MNAPRRLARVPVTTRPDGVGPAQPVATQTIKPQDVYEMEPEILLELVYRSHIYSPPGEAPAVHREAWGLVRHNNGSGRDMRLSIMRRLTTLFPVPQEAAATQ
jgi:hypothetical protein